MGHLDNLTPEILAAAKTGADNTCQTASQSQSGKSADCYWSYISYRIKAGSLIGTSSGRSGGFDLAFYDTAHLNSNVMNPSTFKGRITTGKCVMNYMTETLKTQFMAKMVGARGCGQFSYDIPGTASGVWLAPGNQVISEMEDYHIALIPYSTDSDLYRISIGGKLRYRGYKVRSINSLELLTVKPINYFQMLNPAKLPVTKTSKDGLMVHPSPWAQFS